MDIAPLVAERLVVPRTFEVLLMIDLEQRSFRTIHGGFQRSLYGGTTTVPRPILTLALAALVGLATATAEAGCPNHCTIEPDTVGTTSEPPLPSCVTITPEASGCMCSFSLRVKNGCADTVQAV